MCSEEIVKLRRRLRETIKIQMVQSDAFRHVNAALERLDKRIDAVEKRTIELEK